VCDDSGQAYEPRHNAIESECGNEMDDLHKKRALELVRELERAGMNCGLSAVQGTVVLRCPGSVYTGTPMMFDETDLDNAIALGLLEKRRLTTGSYEWEMYAVKKEKAR